ncbi:hypothetical protein LP420_36540 [Massilia sp. B-10]|nr:hypothetical protein LP420_36540 [Massilia sp. B-10]
MAPPLAWVIPVGEQDVDYDFQPQLAPPPTAAIAAHFAPLSPAQRERALDYAAMACWTSTAPWSWRRAAISTSRACGACRYTSTTALARNLCTGCRAIRSPPRTATAA